MNADETYPRETARRRVGENHAYDRTAETMNADETYQGSIVTEGPLGSWFTLLDFISRLNEVHSDFRWVFFDRFRALLKENDDEVYVRGIPDYILSTQSMHMFVRIERPPRSRKFVLAYVKCDWVFSFARRFEQMRVRLNCIPPVVLRDVEEEENKALRLACVGQTDYERAVAEYTNSWVSDYSCIRYFPEDLEFLTPLGAALSEGDEDAVEVLLDGGDDPNERDTDDMNALHRYLSSYSSISLPLFHRILGMIHDVNYCPYKRMTLLMYAAQGKHLDVVTALMNHPEIDVNIQNRYLDTALHCAVSSGDPAIVKQLLTDDRIDTGIRDSVGTPLKVAIHGLERSINNDREAAIVERHEECVKILREHGAPEEGGHKAQNLHG
jgi:hypothetical protein